jgi:hypothetical protein
VVVQILYHPFDMNIVHPNHWNRVDLLLHRPNDSVHIVDPIDMFHHGNERKVYHVKWHMYLPHQMSFQVELLPVLRSIYVQLEIDEYHPRAGIDVLTRTTGNKTVAIGFEIDPSNIYSRTERRIKMGSSQRIGLSFQQVYIPCIMFDVVHQHLDQLINALNVMHELHRLIWLAIQQV